MKKLKKFALIGLLILGSIGFASASAPITSVPLVTVETPSEVIEVTEGDTNGNGIPDSIEDFYNKNVRDQYMFGIGLGTLLGLVTSVIAIILQIRKTSKAAKLMTETTEKSAETITEMKAQIDTYKTLVENQTKELKTALEKNIEIEKKYTQLVEQTSQKFNDGTKVLANYSKIDEKLNASLECMKELANTKSYIQSGISQKVNTIIEETKK